MEALIWTWSGILALFATLAISDGSSYGWDNQVYGRSYDSHQSARSYQDSHDTGYRPYEVEVHQSYKPKRKTIKCYQCAYSPGKTTYKEIHVPVTVEDPYDPYKKKVEYRIKKVPVRRRGGWDKCLGPFNEYQAKAYGVDVWECHDNCYTRIDAYGNLFRGCYKGEYNVDPNLLGCNKQAGDVYCFCKGDKCNNAGVQGIGRGGRRY